MQPTSFFLSLSFLCVNCLQNSWADEEFKFCVLYKDTFSRLRNVIFVTKIISNNRDADTKYLCVPLYDYYCHQVLSVDIQHSVSGSPCHINPLALEMDI
jgi:hypothetical protein